MSIKVALGQTSTSERKANNLKKGIKMIRAASDQSADLLILPELFMAYIPLSEPLEKFLSIAEPVDGPFVTTLAVEAKRRGIHLVVGLIEKSKKTRVYNTVAMIGSDGSVIAKHRKVQLFDSFGYKESDKITPGEELEGVFETTLAKIGMITCYELRFPELTRLLAMQGAELIIVPAAWVTGRLKEDHLSILARARALENTVFVAVACQTGNIFTGRSTIVDPFGVAICDAGEEEGVVVMDIDLRRIERVRRILPSLHHIKNNIYRKFLDQ
jgi:predicted amidohydrolase